MENFVTEIAAVTENYMKRKILPKNLFFLINDAKKHIKN